ncbi:hypothetical protein L2E82_34182 [Cichorium intybus]|uniref:Uncharacterized protein n=1 Tax=Cichorium intybus TaxID=13427 RepID=A0ACB9BLT4_CICIN|nr:hypothetical protein L2E82_34182 [Cichorium intybus]
MGEGIITFAAVAMVLVRVVVLGGLTRRLETAIGVNSGTLSNHRLAPSTVVDLLRDNNIQKVKLFDADPNCLRALMGSGIEVMIGISSDLLANLNSSTATVDLWVSRMSPDTWLEAVPTSSMIHVPISLYVLFGGGDG